jgi:CO/xanthine dehydrogenase FAD-binding subunit
MILRSFEYVESKTVADAVAALERGDEDARLIAGGTALVPLMKHSVLRPSLLVSIARVKGLADIAPAASGGLRIGGVATHWAVSHATLVQERSPLLAYACARVASPTVRSMGDAGRQPLLRRVRVRPVAGAARASRERPPARPRRCPHGADHRVLHRLL